MIKKTIRSRKNKISNNKLVLLFWILVSLFVGVTLGYEFAKNPDLVNDNGLLQNIGINNELLKAPPISPENVELCFTPPTGCAEAIVRAISRAKNSIYVQAYGMTSPSIVEALITAQKSNVKVRILLDKSNLKDKWSKMGILLEAGIDIAIDNVSGIAHNKVMIIDEQIVITGSFNFTRAADTRNTENVIIINDAVIAKQFLQNWFRRRAQNQSTSRTSTNHRFIEIN